MGSSTELGLLSRRPRLKRWFKPSDGMKRSESILTSGCSSCWPMPAQPCRTSSRAIKGTMPNLAGRCDAGRDAKRNAGDRNIINALPRCRRTLKLCRIRTRAAAARDSVCCRLRFLQTRTAQNVAHGVVSFVAGVLVDRPLGGVKAEFRGPRLPVVLLVFHGEGVDDFRIRMALEGFDHASAAANRDLAFPHLLGMDVDGLDEQLAILIPADGIAEPG